VRYRKPKKGQSGGTGGEFTALRGNARSKGKSTRQREELKKKKEEKNPVTARCRKSAKMRTEGKTFNWGTTLPLMGLWRGNGISITYLSSHRGKP